MKFERIDVICKIFWKGNVFYQDRHFFEVVRSIKYRFSYPEAKSYIETKKLKFLCYEKQNKITNRSALNTASRKTPRRLKKLKSGSVFVMISIM